jgi:hypothetical protein
VDDIQQTFTVVVNPSDDATEHPVAVGATKVDAQKGGQALEASFVHVRRQYV